MINHDLISSYFENSFQIVQNTSYFKAHMPRVSKNITYMVCTPDEAKVKQHNVACDRQEKPGT